jgi:hypothetical protein
MAKKNSAMSCKETPQGRRIFESFRFESAHENNKQDILQVFVKTITEVGVSHADDPFL